MDNKGARAYYRVTENIRDFLLNNDDINTVTIGDITQVNLNNNDLFPLGHLMINNANLKGGIISFNISVMVMDLVWKRKDHEQQDYDETFIGVDNEHDVLNTQLSVVNLLDKSLSKGTLKKLGVVLSGDTSCEPFKDRFENEMAGWVDTANVTVANDISICS